MKKKIELAMVVIAAILTAALLAPADESTSEKHRVLFHLISEGDDQWDAVLGNIENVREALGAADTQVALIAHGKGLGLLIAAGNSHAERMKVLADQGVEFIACENTMRKKNVSRDQLLDFVTTVDSGVAEVVRRQEQGWSYVKSGT